MKAFAVATALVVCVLAGAPGAAAQEAGDRARVWLGAGLVGGASSNVEAGFGLLGQIVVQKRAHYGSLRAVGMGDFAGFPDSGGGDIITEIGLTYGRARLTRNGHAAVAAGASLVAFDTCPNDDDTCFTLGVPIVAEAALSAKFAGIGAQLFTNLNAKAVYGGLAVFIQLGWLP